MKASDIKKAAKRLNCPFIPSQIKMILILLLPIFLYKGGIFFWHLKILDITANAHTFTPLVG
jgi:hypothetical protein